MFRRQKILLSLLAETRRTLPRTSLVQLAFLLRNETSLGDDATFFDFVPLGGSPYSFSMVHELEGLEKAGYLRGEGGRLSLAFARTEESRGLIGQLPGPIREAVRSICGKYGRMSRDALVQDVARRYPWYANGSASHRTESPVSVFTAGYEGTSVERFLDRLLRNGIGVIADVRANPVSRKYGLGRRCLAGVAEKLGIQYRSFSSLGIPRQARRGLDSHASYQRLLDSYERQILPHQSAELANLSLLARREATVLICKEHDARFCHRSRLAAAIARATNLAVCHIRAENGLRHSLIEHEAAAHG